MAVGNLEFIKSVEVTTSTSSVDVTDCFSANYDVYKITTNDFSTVGTLQTALDLRFLDSGGSVVSASNYDYAYLNMKANTTFAEVKNTNQTFIDNIFGVPDQSPEGASSVTYVFNPFSSSSYSFVTNQSALTNASSVMKGQKYIGVLKQTATMSGFRLFEQSTRPFDSGKISVYGLASN